MKTEKIKELVESKEKHICGFGLNYFPNPKSTPLDYQRVKDIMDYCSLLFSEIETISPNRGSYGLKHYVEKVADSYVSNGELIAAMIALGYRYASDGANASFNISGDYRKYRDEIPTIQSIIKKEADAIGIVLGIKNKYKIKQD